MPREATDVWIISLSDAIPAGCGRGRASAGKDGEFGVVGAALGFGDEGAEVSLAVLEARSWISWTAPRTSLASGGLTSAKRASTRRARCAGS